MSQRVPSKVPAVEGEEVEHDVVGRAGGGELAGPGALRCHALQQRREVQGAVTPDDEFAVHDDVGKRGDGVGNLGEADGEIGASTGLQVGPGRAEGDESIAVPLLLVVDAAGQRRTPAAAPGRHGPTSRRRAAAQETYPDCASPAPARNAASRDGCPMKIATATPSGRSGHGSDQGCTDPLLDISPAPQPSTRLVDHRRGERPAPPQRRRRARVSPAQLRGDLPGRHQLRHRRSDPSGPHRSPAPQRGASDGLMRRLLRGARSGRGDPTSRSLSL